MAKLSCERKPFQMTDKTHISNRHWTQLCWLASFMLGIGWLLALALHPIPSQVLPATSPDVLLYGNLIQKASMGFCQGDPFLWEYHQDPKSIFSFFNFWIKIYGKAYSLGGNSLLLLISTLLSGLWFYAVFQFTAKLGEPRPYAFLMAGIQTFFVVNFAYQACGFKTNFAAYNFVTSEHSRIYPSVTAMAFYNLAALGVIHALQRPGIIRTLVAGALVGLVAYGRPFDWMVLMGALTILVAVRFIMKDWPMSRTAILIMAVGGILALPFITDFLQFQKLHHAAYLDQMARGTLHVKNASHYIKYAVFCIVLLGLLSLAFLKWRPLTNEEQPEKIALGWLCVLAASSLLVHFKTALEGGVTLVGFTYLMVFSIAPWFFMLFGYFAWCAFRHTHIFLFESKIWVASLFTLLLTQQVMLGFERVPSPEKIQARQERDAVYTQIREGTPSNPVVMTLGSSLEAGSLGKAWVFMPNLAVSAYTCSADTTELLDRYLLQKLLLTGTLQDLSPLFSTNGFPKVREWITQQNPATRFWLHQLEGGLGSNTFIFHPQKNRADLQYRGIQLPSTIAGETDFVAYFPEAFHKVFVSRSVLEGKSPADILSTLQKQYRIDWIHIPAHASDFVPSARFQNCPGVAPSKLPPGNSEQLWKVLPGQSSEAR